MILRTELIRFYPEDTKLIRFRVILRAKLIRFNPKEDELIRLRVILRVKLIRFNPEVTKLIRFDSINSFQSDFERYRLILLGKLLEHPKNVSPS